MKSRRWKEVCVLKVQAKTERNKHLSCHLSSDPSSEERTERSTMNRCTCLSEVGVPFVLQRVAQTVHTGGGCHVQLVFSCCSLGAKTVGDKQLAITILVTLDRGSGGMASTVTNKDAVEHLSQFACASRDWWKHTKITIKLDQEDALGVLTRTVRDRRGQKNFRGTCASRQLEPSREPTKKSLVRLEP